MEKIRIWDGKKSDPGSRIRNTGCLMCEGWRTLGWSMCLSCTCPAFLIPGSGRDKKSRSGIRNEQPGSYFLVLINHFWGYKYFNSLMRIRDGKNSTPGYGIPDPQHCLFNIWRLTNTRLEHVPELHLPGLLSLDLSANYLADLDCAALENLAQARPQCNRKLETNIPRKGIAWPRSQFLQSCVCERFIYPTVDLPILLPRPILGIYLSLTDTWMWKFGLRPRNSQKRNA